MTEQEIKDIKLGRARLWIGILGIVLRIALLLVLFITGQWIIALLFMFSVAMIAEGDKVISKTPSP